MGKVGGRVRLKGGKGKRWGKGQSSSSNPRTKKHRLAAQGKFGDHLAQVSVPHSLDHGVTLTRDALASHNAWQGGEASDEIASEVLSDVAVEGVTESEEDTASQSTSTAYSLIETAHPVFGRVKRLWNSPMESHREICAVLAAISDVIKSKDGKDTVTEYFGALVTALGSAEDEKSCTAISHLLSIVMPKTPVQVLQARYSSVCKIITDKLSTYEMSDSSSLLKTLINCLMSLLGAQIGSVWDEGYTQRVFQLLLNYTIHPKPKLRKAAQSCVVSFLREGTSSGDFHFAARLTAIHCSHFMANGSMETSVLHLLGMLKDCLANMRTTHVKSLCEQILKLISLGNSVVRSTAYRVLHGLFSSVAGPQGLIPPLNAKLITALYDYQPSLVDVQLLNAWLIVMEAAHLRLLRFDQDLGLAHLPKFFTYSLESFMANKDFVKKTATSLMVGLLKKLVESVPTHLEKDSIATPTLPEVYSISIPRHADKNLFQVIGPRYCSFATLLLGEEAGKSKIEAIERRLGEKSADDDIASAVFQEWLAGESGMPVSWDTLANVLQDINLKSLAVSVRKIKCDSVSMVTARNAVVVSIEHMFKAVELGLKYKFFSSWRYVLQVFTAFYEVAGKNRSCQGFMKESLVSLSELRSTPDFPYCSELDSAFGAAIRTMGPRVVLAAVPLELDTVSSSLDFPRSWILPVLKDHVRETELGYFTEAMLPLAIRLRTKGMQFLQARRPMEAKLYSTLQLQVWSLLPGFCMEPVDLNKVFRPLARILGTALKEKTELQPLVCQALRQLISRSAKHDDERALLACYSKNFLPILFNLYTAPPKVAGEGGERQALLLDCIKAYFTITDQDLIAMFFSRLMSKLRAGSEPSRNHLLLDLALALSPYLPTTSLTSLFNFISPLFNSAECPVQKKAYSCLEMLLSGSTAEHQAFQSDHLESLRGMLVDSLSTVSASSKKPRLRCLLHIVEQLSEESADFVTSIVPEIILCTKEINEKVRVLAYRLIINLGHASQHCFGRDAEESMLKYFSLVLAGLGGSYRMVSCTLLSLSKLVYEFHDLLGTSLVQKLFSSTLVFLSSRKREVVRASLFLVRVAIGVLPSQELQSQIEPLVTGILCWGGNKRNHFRLKSRAVLERLVRKLDYETVASFVPKKHQKLMVHIRRMNDRQKKKKLLERERYTDDEERFDQRKRKNHKPSYEELLESSSDEEEGGESSRTIKRAKQVLYGKKQKDKQGRRGRAVKDEGKAWIKDGPMDEPVNFMDPMVVKRVMAIDPATNVKRSLRSGMFATDSHGRLVISEEGQAGKESSRSSLTEALDEDSSPVMRKRKRADDEDDMDADCSEGLFYGCGIHRTNAKKQDFKYGMEYKAKHAKGDVKKKGVPDPYAYIPLDRQKLNRRKKAKLSGQFKHIVGGAVKGSLAGARKRHKKR